MNRKSALGIITEKLSVDSKTAEVILDKGRAGGEYSDNTDLEQWLEERLFPNVVFIDEEGYTRMSIDALRILETTAATDYGTSRQRDLGQLWADMTRGYLGEYAFLLFLKEKWSIVADLGHEKGNLNEYLPLDIHKVKKAGESEFREPFIKLSNLWC